MQTNINVVSETCVVEAEAFHSDKSRDEAKMKAGRHSVRPGGTLETGAARQN
jgi:hypothetical protein